jgi:hypothetical protein
VQAGQYLQDNANVEQFLQGREQLEIYEFYR